MMNCMTCGGKDFEKHAGFIYCAVCQTQSQDYHEQEYDYHDHKKNVIRRQKSQINVTKSKEPEFYDDGLWTTWEGFNYILYGMTEELKKCGVTEEFEKMVFKFWAAYLKKCEVVFTSKCQEKVPKLTFRFKQRDARILYHMNMSPNRTREKRSRNKSCSSKFSNASVSSVSTPSKKSLALQKGRIIAADYQDNLSLSIQTNSNLADETLETLGRSLELETSEQSSEESKSLLKSFKCMLNKKDFKLYKSSCHSKKLLMNAKDNNKRAVQFLGKNKLLSIIHLALLMTGSDIQLSDLLRFIRESHLSFAKVTHFFPNNVKFPKNDFSYIEVISDNLMPTHLHQRKIVGQLARLLNVEKIPTPDMTVLVDRYCQDLNLPKQIAKFSKKLLADCVPSTIVPRSKTLIPSYEAWAMVSIIIVMKLLFGLNDKTEIFLSHLAREVNSIRNGELSLFVFENWQKFIECRKTVLAKFHYPTQEQLSVNSFEKSENFLETLMKESKDEYRNDRFIPYAKYYMEEKLLNGIKKMLSALSKSQDVASLEFQPSLTPQMTHMITIMQHLSGGVIDVEAEISQQKLTQTTLPEKVLKESFENCDLDFAFEPECYLNLLGEDSKLFTEFDINCESSSSQKSSRNWDSLFNCSTKYWIFEYPTAESGHLGNFKEEILDKIPENFRWFITECARMLEMNVRDVYDELLRLEKKLNSREN